MSEAVEKAEQELELAKLSEEYDVAVETYRDSGTDEDKATKDELAERVVAARQVLRQAREAEAADLDALNEGADGVARPAPIDGTSGVNQ
jgi:hypothetical protein